MADMVKAPAAATAQGFRSSDPATSEINSDENNVSANAVKFHPLADICPLMKGEEFNQLVADLDADGVYQDIPLHEGMILEGRNRYRACLAAGVVPGFIDGDGWIDDPVAYVISANIRRRHLSAEDKQKALVRLVAAQVEKSDRVLAKLAGVDHKTMAKARRKAESTGDASPVDKRVGKDGKARKQP